MRARHALLASACVALGSGAARAEAARVRVVSINPCVDAVLVRVAEPDQILAISHYSQDPEASSIPLDIARRFKITSETAEEVVALAPDIVMSGPHVAPSTVFALERMHIRIAKFSVAESVEESERQIRTIAGILGRPARGAALIASINRAIEAARAPDERLVSALIWQGGGMVPGRGTLADQLMQLTGYRNMSSAYGLQKWDILPLEYLIASPPDVVLSMARSAAARDPMLGHPAIRELSKHVAFRTYPFRLVSCGGPSIVQAVSRLSEIRRDMETRP